MAVVGAGVTGLTTALLLQRYGSSVAVLEAGEIGDGVTGATTAHLTALPDVPAARLLGRLGTSDGRLYMSAAADALFFMERLARGMPQGCGWQGVPTYLYVERPGGERALAREADALRLLGVPVSMTYRPPLPFQVSDAIMVRGQARFDLFRYLLGLARLLSAAGGRVFEATRVHGTRATAVGHRLTTEYAAVTARHVIFSGESSRAFGPAAGLTTAWRTYEVGLMARAPLADGLFRDMAAAGHSIRAEPDVQQRGSLLILRGERHQASQKTDAAERFARLEAHARQRWDVGSVVHRSSREWHEPADGMPYIGRVAKEPNAFHASGFASNNLVLGTLAARILADRVRGRATPIGDLLDASRHPPLCAVPAIVGGWLSSAREYLRLAAS